MAQTKYAGFRILLLFSAWIFAAYAHQGGDAVVAVSTVSKGEGVFDERSATTATEQIVGGRKMSPLVKARKLEKVKESIAAVEQTSISSTTSHKLAAKCEGKEMSNAKYCNKSVSHQHSEDIDDKGFVAFNADYHAPRHHPPKNN